MSDDVTNRSHINVVGKGCAASIGQQFAFERHSRPQKTIDHVDWLTLFASGTQIAKASVVCSLLLLACNVVTRANLRKQGHSNVMMAYIRAGWPHAVTSHAQQSTEYEATSIVVCNNVQS